MLAGTAAAAVLPSRVGGLSEIDGADRRHAILILVAHPPRDDDPGKPGM